MKGKRPQRPFSEQLENRPPSTKGKKHGRGICSPSSGFRAGSGLHRMHPSLDATVDHVCVVTARSLPVDNWKAVSGGCIQRCVYRYRIVFDWLSLEAPNVVHDSHRSCLSASLDLTSVHLPDGRDKGSTASAAPWTAHYWVKRTLPCPGMWEGLGRSSQAARELCAWLSQQWESPLKSPG